MRRVVLILSILLISCFSFTGSAHAEPPKRIISLAPNVTEILFALGLGDRVVGVTNFCDYPEDAKKKTKVGGISNPSLETIVSLRPDIVVATTDGNPREFVERLHSLEIKTYVFRARRLRELPDGIRVFGITLGVQERAKALASEIETAMHMFAVRGEKKKKKVLFILWTEPLIVAGPRTPIDDAVTLLGGENIASKAKASYPKYSIEEIIYQSPDVIFIGKGHLNIREISRGLLERLATVPAVEKGDVFYVSDSIYRLGPRVVRGIEEMAGCLK